MKYIGIFEISSQLHRNLPNSRLQEVAFLAIPRNFCKVVDPID